MDPALAGPSTAATKDVLSARADLDVVAGTPYVKKNTMTCGLVSAMIGITGDRQGAFCVSFERDTAVHIVTQMLGEAIEDLMLDVQDARVRIQWPKKNGADSLANLSDSSWDSPRSTRAHNTTRGGVPGAPGGSALQSSRMKGTPCRAASSRNGCR